MPCELKITFYLIFLVCIFLIESFIFLGIIAIILLVLFRLMPLQFSARGRHITLMFLLFTFLGNIFGREGRVIFAMGPLLITTDGLTVASLKVVKLTLMMAGACLLCASASVDSLLKAFGRIVRPLQYVGIPVNDFISAMSLTVTFLPQVKDECLKIYREKVRDQNVHGFRNRAKVAMGLLMPLFVKSLEKPERYFPAGRGRLHNT